jgi:hypothetical protein
MTWALRQTGQPVQVGGVDALERRGAVARALRERIAVVLAADARFAVRRRRRITLDDEPGCNLALDGLLEAVCANVAQMALPEGAAQRGFAAQGGFRCGRCGGVEPGCAVANGSGEAVLAVLHEHHLLALNLDTEAVIRDKVENGKEIVLQRGDIQDA